VKCDSEAVLGVWLPAPLPTPRAPPDHGAIWPLAVGVEKDLGGNDVWSCGIVCCSLCGSTHPPSIHDLWLNYFVFYLGELGEKVSPVGFAVRFKLPYHILTMSVYSHRYSQTVYIQRAHEQTRTGNWSESGFGSLRGAPLNISRCLGGGSRRRDPSGRLKRQRAARIYVY